MVLGNNHKKSKKLFVSQASIMTFKINVSFRNIVHYLVVAVQHNLWDGAERY